MVSLLLLLLLSPVPLVLLSPYNGIVRSAYRSTRTRNEVVSAGGHAPLITVVPLLARHAYLIFAVPRPLAVPFEGNGTKHNPEKQEDSNEVIVTGREYAS